MLISIEGQDVEISGNINDPYFQMAQSHVDDLGDLVSILSRVAEDAVIFDVGANIGLSAISMSLVKPHSRIFAFEPSPDNVVFLKKNIINFPNITVVEAALSNEAGAVMFHLAGYGAGSHVVGRSHIIDGIASVSVPAIRLDDFAEAHGLYPQLIKIDVEGHEPEALAGAQVTLTRCRPYVFMEFNTWTLNAFAGHSPAAFAKALWRSYDLEIKGAECLDVIGFLHDHFVKEHCIADLVMRPKNNVAMPSLEEMSFSPSAIEVIKRGQMPRE